MYLFYSVPGLLVHPFETLWVHHMEMRTTIRHSH
jgi:hypothetical protein